MLSASFVGIGFIDDWGEPKRAPHWRVAHTRFIVDSVQENYKQIRQTTLQVYHNMVSTEGFLCYQPLNRKYAIRAWCYQP